MRLRDINPEFIGPVLQTAGLEAAKIALNLWPELSSHHSIKPDGTPVTSGDVMAQLAVERVVHSVWPNIRILGEEDMQHDYNIPRGEVIVCVDPLDGTRAYAEHRPGWATQLALLEITGRNSYRAVAAYVIVPGYDIALGFSGPDNPLAVHYANGHSELIAGPDSTGHKDRQMMTAAYRGNLTGYDHNDGVYQRLYWPRALGGFFASQSACPDSIAMTAYNVVMGSIDALLLHGGRRTVKVWDQAPMIAILEKLGFCGVQISEEGVVKHVVEPKALAPFARRVPILYCTPNCARHIEAWLNSH